MEETVQLSPGSKPDTVGDNSAGAIGTCSVIITLTVWCIHDIVY